VAKKTYTYDYPRPSVAVDLVLASKEAAPRVLLIRRKHEPFAGCWALPGGFIEMDESLEESARRELREETGLDTGALIPLGVYGDPGRDPRGRTISVVYLAQVNPKTLRPRAADDAADVDWFALSRPPKLAFDHAKILADARRTLKERNARKRKP
jgi:8-oxo-dGTP diphosphatase